MTDLLAPAGVITISIGIMQMMKYADTNNVFKRFYPIGSFFIGLILGVLFHFTLLVTLTTALSVAGTYDGFTFSLFGKGQA